MCPNDRYKTLIEFLFNRAESEGDWRYLDETDEEENAILASVSDQELVSYLIKMFENCSTDLLVFSDWQLNKGLNYIFNNFVYSVYKKEIPLTTLLRFINSLKHLYEECFQFRCESALSHLAGAKNPLNDICYMLWDIISIPHYYRETEDREEIYEVTHKLWECVLSLSNIACIESALHGIGHNSCEYSDRITKMVDKFILSYSKNPEHNKDLINYAQCAKRGMIQ